MSKTPRLTVIAGGELERLEKPSETPSFADAPESLSEMRAERTHNAALWTPRDALIAVLREIDQGASCDALVVVWRERDADGEKGATVTRFANATPDAATALGLLRLCEWQMLG